MLSCVLVYKTCTLAVFGVYRSPAALTPATLAMYDYIRARQAQLHATYTLVMGDFNIDMLTPHTSRPQLLRQHLLQPLGLHMSTQLVPSTIHGTCLGHVHTDWPSDQVHFGTLNSYISDHYPAYATLSPPQHKRKRP